MIVKKEEENKLIQSAADALNLLFKKYSPKPFLFLSSGGSSLKILDYVNPIYFNSESTLTILDERYSKDASVNNFAQLEETSFYKNVAQNKCQIINTKPLENETMHGLAERFESQLKKWLENYKDGVIIASIGIGSDSHTAGIMPYPENNKFFEDMFNNKDSLVVAYDATGKNLHRDRVTTTLPFLRKIKSAVVLASGDSKKNALINLLSDNGNLAESPCRILRELENVQIFTDQDITG